MPGYLRILAYLIIRQKPGFALHYFDSLYFSIYEYRIHEFFRNAIYCACTHVGSLLSSVRGTGVPACVNSITTNT